MGVSYAELIEIRKNQTRNVIIFIHGLNGDPIYTWKKEKSTEGLIEAVCNDTALSSIFDVYSFGYRTGAKPGQYDFNRCAELLFSEISAKLPVSSNIVFIT